ncbi:hypothetical protein RSAG8_12864, partial [Rhizoctonia solani AG-8 WAC10335]
MLYRLSDKVQKAKSALKGLQTHEAKKTWLLQLMGINPFDEAALDYKTLSLMKAIKLKLSEVCLLEQNLHPGIWLDEFNAITDKTLESGPATELVPYFQGITPSWALPNPSQHIDYHN